MRKRHAWLHSVLSLRPHLISGEHGNHDWRQKQCQHIHGEQDSAMRVQSILHMFGRRDCQVLHPRLYVQDHTSPVCAIIVVVSRCASAIMGKSRHPARERTEKEASACVLHITW
ncbi:hypothetical protein DFJ77DRAFT_461958 [Powellomyces hirtus]|nr:hypothetical protein DFJ77DRAFT_481941 [Powellomyces hirtus]KAI8915272.1 hypothetical protein DFJ77DRAFT_461958 [Powellomyces hirtus]